MPHYDFDSLIDRHGSGALKTDALKERYGEADLIPLWVADMDFATPPFIVEALRRRLDHPVYGYTIDPPDYYPTIARWLKARHGWDVKTEWLSYIPGIVKGIGMVINVFTQPGDKVIIQPPVYHPFRLTTKGNGREVVNNPLIPTADGGYEMDFEGLARVADDKCRLLILSNPHNPGGVIWPRETLERLAAFCDERGIIVISDEIHADMALYGHRHTPFATVSEAAARCSITFGAPSKTFNIAGIVSSYAVVPDEGLRTRFYSWLRANELNEPTLFAPIATMAAFNEGEPWRREMLRYVEGNIDYVISYLGDHLPLIRPHRPDASFLIWLDCRPLCEKLGLDQRGLVHLFVEEARLALNDGAMFGPGGEGHMRLNVGCPRQTLEQAMRQLSDAVARAGA